MSKSQQKSTFNEASNLQGTAGNDAAAALTTANSDLSGAGSAYSGLLPTGGFNPGQLSTLEGAETSNLGGLDPSALNALSGQYQDLISSGGISDATQAAMQRQATAGVSSIYGTLEQQQARNRAVTGGQGGGGETAELARQLSSAEANAVTGVNSSVGQLRQQGTEAGLAGASNLAASQAAAQNAAANTFSGTQSNVASGALGAAGGLTNVAGLQSGLYSTGLNAQLGALGAQSGIANAEQGPFGNILQGVNAIGNLAGGAGSLLTGIGKFKGCWIAEATYGIDDPRTHIARSWVNSVLKNHSIGKYLFNFYIKYGQKIAAKIYKYPFLKHFTKPLFDLIPGVKYVAS